MTRRTVAWLLCFATLAFAGGCRVSAEAPAATQGKPTPPQTPASPSHPLIGKAAPDFELADLTGKKWCLFSLRGKSIAVLEFASTSCYCGQRGLMDLDWVRQNYANPSIQTLAIGFEDQPLRPPAEFLTEAGLKIPFLKDPELKTAAAYSVQWPPTVVIVDRAGTVRWFGDEFNADVADKASAQLNILLAAEQAWSADSEYGKLYDRGQPVTITGMVVASEPCTPVKDMAPGVALTVREGQRPRVVHLGPAWYVDSQPTKLAANESVTVTGVLVRLKGKSIILAREVRRGQESLVFRDPDGKPRW